MRPTNIMEAIEMVVKERLHDHQNGHDVNGECHACADELAAFDDGPAVGLGHDGLTHSDPYCAMIAPLNSVEYRRGEMCERCVEREDANEERPQHGIEIGRAR